MFQDRFLSYSDAVTKAATQHRETRHHINPIGNLPEDESVDLSKDIESPISSVESESPVIKRIMALMGSHIDKKPHRMDRPTIIICGQRAIVERGWRFQCIDQVANVCYNCVGSGSLSYRCWDGGEWEWANYNERDGTPDNSPLTSIATDGIAITSPSVDLNPGAPIPGRRANRQEAEVVTDNADNESIEEELNYECELESLVDDDALSALSITILASCLNK